MKAHVIENGVIVNTIEVKDLSLLPNLVSAEHGGRIGDRYDGGQFSSGSPQLTIAQHNAPILAELQRIDAKSIRPLREGDQVRIDELEAQAAALRLQLRKE